MELHVVHDAEARIIAASIPDRGPSPVPRAVPGSGHTEAQVSIPDEITQLELKELLKRVAIDPQSRKPVFKA